MPSASDNLEVPKAELASMLRARVVEVAVLTFVGLIGCAMALYPGGTWYDRTRKGHAFWENFLCDLLHRTSISGEPNEPGWLLATIGMLALVCGLVAFVWLVPTVVTIQHGLLRALRRVALVACLCLIGIPLLPTDRFGDLHAVAVLSAGVPATLCLAILIGQLAWDQRLPRWMRLLSVTVIASIVLSLALYVHETFFGGGPLRILPSIARVATILLVCWLLAFAQFARRASRAQ